MAIKLAIVGSRSFDDFTLLERCVKNNYKIEDISIIISGGAIGTDSLAKRFAEKYELEYKEFLPDWSKGKTGAYIRNRKIITYADSVLAFWDGKSPGTKMTIDLTNRAGKNIKVIRV